MQSKRYFSRPIEDEPDVPSWFSSSKTHQPYHALAALILAYYLLTYITNLRHRAIDAILLRSFPAWSEKYTHLRLHTPHNATLALTLAVAARVWPWYDQHLWRVVLGVVPLYAGLEMGIVAVVWVFEQFLLWSWRLGRGVGWVPEGEEGWVRLSVQGVKPAERATGEPNGETPTHGSPKSHTQFPSWLPQRLNFLTRSYRGTRVQTSAGWETYQSITAEEKYQAKSFEELRNEQYEQDHAKEVEDGRSVFGRSLSFLGDLMSFLRRRERTPSEEFLDAKSEVGGEGVGEGTEEVPDLLTGSPRRMFT